jgi:hypothetical protein
MSKMHEIITKALEDEKVMGFDGLTPFSKAKDYLYKKKLIGKEAYPVQVLKTKLNRKQYACCLFGDVPDDTWCVIELTPKQDAYIGETFKTRVAGVVVRYSQEIENAE